MYISFPTTYRVASWAIINGGLTTADGVTWLEVSNKELEPPTCPTELFTERLQQAHIDNYVGLMTSASLQYQNSLTVQNDNLKVSCTSTVGLSNAMRIGEQTNFNHKVGTINTVCRINQKLSDQALLEGLAMITEAKTAAVLDANILSYQSSELATETGTDCCVIASPLTGNAIEYCGKHTVIGQLIGEAVYQCITMGINSWKQRHPDSPVTKHTSRLLFNDDNVRVRNI